MNTLLYWILDTLNLPSHALTGGGNITQKICLTRQGLQERFNVLLLWWLTYYTTYHLNLSVRKQLTYF